MNEAVEIGFSGAHNGAMRWDELFDDLEALAAQSHRAELDAEVADRVRRERAQVTVRARLATTRQPVRVHLAGGVVVDGSVVEVGSDWCVVADGAARLWLVPVHAILQVVGLGWSAATQEADVGRRFRFGMALRALARDRTPVHLYDVAGGRCSGTIDAVGADHLDFSEHPIDVPRRSANIQARRVVPFPAVAAVASAVGTERG